MGNNGTSAACAIKRNAVIENVEFLADWKVDPSEIIKRLQTGREPLVRRLIRAGRLDLARYIDVEPYDMAKIKDAIRSPF